MTQKTHLVIGMLVLFSTSISFGQDMKQHIWKDRVIKIVTKNKESNIYKKQIQILKSDPEGIKERKLVIHIQTETTFQLGLYSETWLFTSKELYSEAKKTNKDFEILLIGLDGGVKLRQTELLSLKKLFALIDGMPMRRQELKN